MSTKTILSAAVMAGSLFAATAAHAVITINPDTLGTGSTINGAVTSGLDSNLTSLLKIDASSGSNVGFLETGFIEVIAFRNGGVVASDVGVNYKVLGNFSLSGQGDWTGGTFTADPGASFNMNLGAYDINTNALIKNLGVATLAPGPSLAFAIAFDAAPPLTPGESGAGLTSFTAILGFTPTPGELNAGGFFAGTALPFNVVLSVGNAGGNPSNTGYSVAADGSVTFVTPIGTTNPGTANITFVRQDVPEPGALALVGIALAGLGLSRRRKVAC